jgi:hypothetical protein
MRPLPGILVHAINLAQKRESRNAKIMKILLGRLLMAL